MVFQNWTGGKKNNDITNEGLVTVLRCDRHGYELAGVSPAIALEMREYAGKGKLTSLDS